MKKSIIVALLLSSWIVKAQIYDPVEWSTTVEKISSTEYELIAMASIDGDWHLYSQAVPNDGPIPTTFSFEGNDNYLKKGNTKEENGHIINDPIFNMEIKYFVTKVSFKQRIRLKNTKAFHVNAVVEYMVCDDTKCLPPKEVELVFEIN